MKYLNNEEEKMLKDLRNKIRKEIFESGYAMSCVNDENKSKLVDDITMRRYMIGVDVKEDIDDETFYQLSKKLSEELRKENYAKYAGLMLQVDDFITKIETIKERDGVMKKLPDNLILRYEELIKAINNNMQLSFFWLAGSIIECLLRKYCKNNNITSKKNNIYGYITAIKQDKKHKKNIPGRIKKTIPIYQDYRNIIHPNNQNNDFINGKNLQIYKEELDNVIKYFCNDTQSN